MHSKNMMVYTILVFMIIYTYIYIYINIYIHVYIYIHVIIYIYIYTYVIIYIYIHTYIRTYVRTYIHTCMHACMHAYIHTCMHACMHACIHTYIHTYMHMWSYICHFGIIIIVYLHGHRIWDILGHRFDRVMGTIFWSSNGSFRVFQWFLFKSMVVSWGHDRVILGFSWNDNTITCLKNPRMLGSIAFDHPLKGLRIHFMTPRGLSHGASIRECYSLDMTKQENVWTWAYGISYGIVSLGDFTGHYLLEVDSWLFLLRRFHVGWFFPKSGKEFFFFFRTDGRTVFFAGYSSSLLLSIPSAWGSQAGSVKPRIPPGIFITGWEPGIFLGIWTIPIFGDMNHWYEHPYFG